MNARAIADEARRARIRTSRRLRTALRWKAGMAVYGAIMDLPGGVGRRLMDRKKHLSTGPDAVMLSITARCSFTCAYCAAADYPDGKPELTLDEIRAFLAQIAASPVNYVFLFGGEPFIRADVMEIIGESRSWGFTTWATTNGWHTGAREVREMKRRGLDLLFVSIDSADRARHDAARGRAGSFDRCVELLDRCRAERLRTAVFMTVTRETIANGEIGRMAALCRRRGAGGLHLLVPIPVGRCSPDKSLTDAEMKLLESQLVPGFVCAEAAIFDRASRPFRCPTLDRQQVFVSHSGEVWPCCYAGHDVHYGNIRTEPLMTIVDRMFASPFFTQPAAGRCPSCRHAQPRDR